MNTSVAIHRYPPSVARRLRICFVTETYPPEINGVAMTALQLVSGLLTRGHEVQLIRPSQGGNDIRRREGRLEIVPQPSMSVPFYREVKLGLPVSHVLLRLWRQKAPDVVHICTEGLLGGAALRSAQRLGLPVSSGFHTNFHRYSDYYGLGLLATPIVNYLWHFHNRITCTLVPTQELAKHVRESGFRNIRVLSRGIDTQLFSPQRRSQTLRQHWQVAPQEPAVLYVGRLAAEKNLPLALAAFKAIREVFPQARLVLVGDGPLAAKLKSQEPEAIFCGMRSGKELAAHYASADLFLFPSLTETFGNVMLEAMTSGLAAVAFDYAAAHQFIVPDSNGLLVPFGDIEAFIKAARYLACRPAQRQRLGQTARRTMETVGWEQVCEHLETIFLELGR
jgi:glycosyltransferase involved in cell wall biosynthesis